ncbi:hypothetical protein JXA02_06655, partial [candidate division KSB1 bacterium]|nr:hypothetical protein [candidate division KSB1 bacterium]
KAYVTVNTPASKGIIGCIENEEIELNEWEITCDNRFAVILTTDLAPAGNLRTAERILLTAVARGRNSGMTYETIDGKKILTNKGTRPLLLEPVRARITLKSADEFQVIALDHDGAPTEHELPIKENSFIIDGEKYRTIYYLIEKKPH